MGYKPLKKAPQTKADELPVYPEGGKFWLAEADGEKEILFAKKGVASKEGTPANTLMQVFELAAKKKGTKVALRTEAMPMIKKGEAVPGPIELAKWKSWTWKQYISDIRIGARALISLGVEQHDAVNIFGFNSPEWLIGQMSAIFSGAKAAGIYPSDTADQVQFKSFHSNGAAAFVENEECFEKFAEVIEDLPYMKAIICWAYDGGKDITRSDGSVVKVMTFEEFLKLGKKSDEAKLDERIKMIKPEHCCALIYTSGTTGRPKAVMISHDNIIFEANTMLPLTGVGAAPEEERILSYLPLSHVAGMLFDIIAPVVITAYKKAWVCLCFARPYDLKAGTIGARLTTVQPTVFLGVPRVWEKIAEKLKAIGAQTTGIKKKLSTTAKKKGLEAMMNRQIGGNGKTPFMYGVYSKLLNVIKGKLGLSKCKFAFAGAAPMTREILAYFGSLGINVNEAYGMSESCAATSTTIETCFEHGTVGFELPGTEVKCFKLNADGSKTEVPRAKNAIYPTEEEQGELCFRGRHIMMGYMANPKLGEEHVAEIEKKNMEAIDEEGWLHSGDKGCISTRGMIRVTGRYKEIIIGAGGENIAPVPIEDNMKRLCPFISNIMMVGDKRKFNVALVSLKCEGATGELPGSNKLEGDAAAFGKTIEEAASNDKLIKALTAAFKETGNDGNVTPSNAAKIQKFTILPTDFSVVGEELTATLKLKRSVVNDKYIDIIDAMYESKDVYVPYSLVGSFSVKSASNKEDVVAAGSFKTDKPLDLVDDEDVSKVEDAAEDAEEMPEQVTA
mmetsp:Transcript_4373/g.6161  ORF Transcript_4373/g.6161 Transcript_4373/m.6161 type:complete len:787 (-) Transcript_4373:150-2510(-)